LLGTDPLLENPQDPQLKLVNAFLEKKSQVLCAGAEANTKIASGITLPALQRRLTALTSSFMTQRIQAMVNFGFSP